MHEKRRCKSTAFCDGLTSCQQSKRAAAVNPNTIYENIYVGIMLPQYTNWVQFDMFAVTHLVWNCALTFDMR